MYMCVVFSLSVVLHMCISASLLPIFDKVPYQAIDITDWRLRKGKGGESEREMDFSFLWPWLCQIEISKYKKELEIKKKTHTIILTTSTKTQNKNTECEIKNIQPLVLFLHHTLAVVVSLSLCLFIKV